MGSVVRRHTRDRNDEHANWSDASDRTIDLLVQGRLKLMHKPNLAVTQVQNTPAYCAVNRGT